MLERLKTTARHLATGIRSHGATFLTFIGAILAIIGVVTEIKLPPPTPVSLRYLGPIGASLAAVGALLSSFQAAYREEDLKQKNETIINLQKRLSDSLLGGEDFARIVSTAPKVRVMGPEKYSLYDINILYTDTALMREYGIDLSSDPYSMVSESAFTAVGTAPYHRFFRIDFLHPNSEFRVIREIDTSAITLPFVINARFTARNGQWHQIMVLDADVASQSVGTATVLMRDGKVLFKSVVPGYPYKDKLFRNLQDKEA